MTVQLNMVILIVKDMAASLSFYRRIGLEIPEGEEHKPIVLHRMESGVTLLFDTTFADTYDPGRTPSQGGYQVMLEFFLADNDAVDTMFRELTTEGYHGRRAPVQTNGPYAAMVDDPDGNVVLLTAG